MKRKRFIKLCMAEGLHRNAANYLARHKDDHTARLLGRASATHQITNCKETKDGAVFKAKRRVSCETSKIC